MAKKIRCWADGENLGIYTHAVDQGAGSVATRVLRKLPGEVNFLFDVKIFSRGSFLFRCDAESEQAGPS